MPGSELSPRGTTGCLTIPALLDLHASENPDRTALEVWGPDKVEALTYRELRRRSAGWAQWLSSRGVTRGERVLILSESSADLVAVLYAVGILGAVAVPLSPAWVDTEVEAVARRVRPQVALVSTPERRGELSGVAATVSTIAEAGQEAATTSWDGGEHPAVGSRDPFQIIFTSGTTASPKGVVLSHANCLGGAAQAGAAVGWGRGERFASALPLFHVNAQSFCLWSALVWCGTSILFPAFSASAFPQQLSESGATVTSLVSTQVRTMLLQGAHLQGPPKALRHIIFAINISDAERQAFEEAWSVTLRNGYGLSEAMTLVTIEASWFPSRLWPSVGFPAPGRKVRIVDESGIDVDPGTVGELLIGGEPGIDLMLGYWEDPEATASALADGWLRTGDLMRFGGHGELYYVGRLKEVIKVAGENVSAAEVEEAVLTHPAVLECAVISLPDPVRDERVCAVIVARDTMTTEALTEHLKQRLAPAKRPSVLRFVDALPRTNIGKVDKRAIRAGMLQEEESDDHPT